MRLDAAVERTTQVVQALEDAKCVCVFNEIMNMSHAPGPNEYKVKRFRLSDGTPQAVTNVGVGTKFRYKKSENIDCLRTQFENESILHIADIRHTQGWNYFDYELCNTETDVICWVTTRKLIELIDAGTLLEIPQEVHRGDSSLLHMRMFVRNTQKQPVEA